MIGGATLVFKRLKRLDVRLHALIPTQFLCDGVDVGGADHGSVFGETEEQSEVA